MAGNIVWEWGCADVRQPARAGATGAANRGDRTPEVKGVFRVPCADGGGGHRDVQEREKPGILLQRIVLCGSDALRAAVPVAGTGLGTAAASPAASERSR